MRRMRFMQAEKGRQQPRVEVYMLKPRPDLDKERRRIIKLNFSLKLDADKALMCDSRIQRAFEDCTDLDRQIEQVSLRSKIENSDVEFYELPTANTPTFKLENCALEALLRKRDDGQAYLYFVVVAMLSVIGLGKFALDRYGTALFCEFRPSQFAIDWDAPITPLTLKPEDFVGDVQEMVAELKGDPVMLDALARLCPDGDGVTSTTIESGGQAVTLTHETGKKLRAAAKKAREEQK